jgi:hypothetical protein
MPKRRVGLGSRAASGATPRSRASRTRLRRVEVAMGESFGAEVVARALAGAAGSCEGTFTACAVGYSMNSRG